MTRPLDDRIASCLRDDYLSATVEILLRECRAALATAREDGAREERERIVAYLRDRSDDRAAQHDALVAQGRSAASVWFMEAAGLLDLQAHQIASGKHRQEKP